MQLDVIDKQFFYDFSHESHNVTSGVITCVGKSFCEFYLLII